MAKRLFGIYALVEMAVIIALVATIGFGWTVLLLLASFVVGLALAGSQLNRQIRRLRSGFADASAPADSLLVALGTVLVVIPGLASSLLGVLLLLPPTRAAARPMLTAMAAKRIPIVTVGAPGFTWPGGAAAAYGGRGDYIDGEVIDGDVTDFQPEPHRLPPTA